MPAPTRLLFAVHGAVTLAAGVVLFAAPSLIPSVVGISLPTDAYVLSYLLGAAEIALAWLSFGVLRAPQAATVMLAASVFIVFHVLTAVGEIYAYTQGASATIWVNVGVRVIVSILFGYFGMYLVRADREGGAPASSG